jgi:hypothetical protein
VWMSICFHIALIDIELSKFSVAYNMNTSGSVYCFLSSDKDADRAKFGS